MWSRDCDNTSAIRYTEVHLTSISKLLLDELDEYTIDFISNYDDNQKELTVFLSRFPMILLNGTSGIAIGMTIEIALHNIREVAQA